MREPPVLRHRKINHLPYDIVLSILRRLPVKSVIRFKCVSKSLDSSITSPDFIYAHLNQNNNNNNETKMMMIIVISYTCRFLFLVLIAVSLNGIEVYTLSSDSWRRVRIATNGIYYFQNDLFPAPLEKKDPDIQYPSLVATFMESLVLLDGANMVSH
uniref:F-box domain-containing protein n=1 Tax=Quercus lobata TaxID=97700 RepID=A0A7N2LI43_QUELO